MNKHLQQLIEVTNLDKEIDFLEPKIVQKRAKLDRLLKEKDQKEQEIFNLKEEKSELDLRIKNTYNMIEETSIRIENINKKHHDAKSEREVKALTIEEELAKEQLNKANQDIEYIQREQKQKSEKIASIEIEINEINQEIQVEETQSAKEIEVIKKEQEKLYHKKQELYALLDQKIATFYEKIRKWAKNTSVVAVKKQACGGCFIRINDRIYTEVKQSNEIINCPHCGRILYIES